MDVCDWSREASTHFSLDIHRDTQEQRQIEAHFQDVIPVMSFSHWLQNKKERDNKSRFTPMWLQQGLCPPPPHVHVRAEKDLKNLWCFGGKGIFESSLCPTAGLDST